MRCPHPDWLDNRLAVTGPAAELAAFRAAAAGAGVAPWALDYDAIEEDLFNLMMAPPPVGARTISAGGARTVARDVREMVWEDHEEALSRVGVDRGCPFDLHTLVPVPWPVLRLGPDHPSAVDWMWGHWGTTWHLRRVEACPLPAGRRDAPAPGDAGCLIRFWSADWSPWPAVRECRRRWPELRFELAVEYWWDLRAERHPEPGRRRRRAA